MFRISSINSSTWETFVGPDPIFPRFFRSRGGWSFNWISNWRCLVWILSSSAGSQRVLQLREDQTLLLMEEILQQLIKSLYHYLQGFIPPRWCRISSINSVTCRWLHPELAEELAFLRRLRRLNMKAGRLKSWQKVMLEIKTFCLVLSAFVFSMSFIDWVGSEVLMLRSALFWTKLTFWETWTLMWKSSLSRWGSQGAKWALCIIVIAKFLSAWLQLSWDVQEQCIHNIIEN